MSTWGTQYKKLVKFKESWYDPGEIAAILQSAHNTEHAVLIMKSGIEVLVKDRPDKVANALYGKTRANG